MEVFAKQTLLVRCTITSMPLARTITARSKSRSPIPPNYLPTSHYAMAAGITYTPSSRSESSNSTHFPASDDLETQLLPSLRDTIDRMARSPYQLDSGFHLGVSKSSNNSARTSPSMTQQIPTSKVYTTPIESFPPKTNSFAVCPPGRH